MEQVEPALVRYAVVSASLGDLIDCCIGEAIENGSKRRARAEAGCCGWRRLQLEALTMDGSNSTALHAAAIVNYPAGTLSFTVCLICLIECFA